VYGGPKTIKLQTEKTVIRWNVSPLGGREQTEINEAGEKGNLGSKRNGENRGNKFKNNPGEVIPPVWNAKFARDL